MSDNTDLFELAKATRDTLMNGFLGEVEKRYAAEAAEKYPPDHVEVMIDGGVFGIHLSVLMQTFIAKRIRMLNGKTATDAEMDKIVAAISYAIAHMLVNLSSNFRSAEAGGNRESLQKWMTSIAPICMDMIASVDAGQAEGMRLDDQGDGTMQATPFVGDLPRNKDVTKH